MYKYYISEKLEKKTAYVEINTIVIQRLAGYLAYSSIKHSHWCAEVSLKLLDVCLDSIETMTVKDINRFERRALYVKITRDTIHRGNES